MTQQNYIGPSHPQYKGDLMGNIIAFSGYARAGKDTAAEVLISEYDFVRVGFADKLREFLYRLNPTLSVAPTTVGAVIDEWGWDGYKETVYKDEIRELLQRLGTECGRQLLYDNVWVEAALNSGHERLVITDTRFPNEADAVRERGGMIVRVHRNGVGPINDHPSETSLDNYDFDHYIFNNGDKEDLYNQVRELL